MWKKVWKLKELVSLLVKIIFELFQVKNWGKTKQKKQTNKQKQTDIANNISFLYFLNEHLNRLVIILWGLIIVILTYIKKIKNFKWKKSELFWNFWRKCFVTLIPFFFFPENLFENFLYFYFYSLFNFIFISKVFLILLTSILSWNAIVKVTVWVLGSWSSFLLKESSDSLFWSITAVWCI